MSCCRCSMHRSHLFPAFGIYMLWMFGDEVLCQVAKSEPCGVIQRDRGRFLGVLGEQGTNPSISVVNPKPRRKVWLICIKKTFHPILDPCRYILCSCMRGPVLSRVSDQREGIDVVTVNALVQSEENPEACFCKNRMRCLKLNVIARDISCGLRKPVRRQELLDREVRKLDHSRIAVLVLEYRNQT